MIAGAIAPGNRARFLQAGLIDEFGELVPNWQAAVARLAPLKKGEVRLHPGSFLARADNVVYRGTTSGTTSASFTYFAGESWNRQRTEGRERSLAWWELAADTPMLNLASRLGPVRLQDSSLVGQIDADFVETLLQIVAAQPVIIRGYPSRLCEVVVALHRYGLFPPFSQVANFVAVIATGECLFEAQRSLLTKTFHAPVINEYGCQESGISGLSCPEVGRLHLDGDRCLYEVIEGKLLTTDLYNTTMPMVRYSSGDVLALCPEACSCGRPGPTARVLGREEESLLLGGKKCWTGDVELPAFAGILSYQIQLHADRRQLWIQPESAIKPDGLEAIKVWTEEIFGSGSTGVLTEVLIESPLSVMDETDLRGAISSADWTEQVTTGAWLSWLQQPLPMGKAQAVAALLKQLVAPCHTVAKGLSPQTLRQIEKLAVSEISQDSSLEVMKIRVLLWATSLMTEENMAENTSARAADLYSDLLKRFERWRSGSTAEIEQFSALGFDLLAPMLTLDTLTVKSLWPSVHQIVQRCWPEGPKADAFTMHHYLAVLDIAGQNAQRGPHPWLPALRPLSAILLGDFYQLAAGLTHRTVTLWAEMVHGCPNEFAEAWAAIDLETIDKATDFYGIWQAGRRSLLNKNKILAAQQLNLLFERASSPVQIAQCWLEKGYAALVFGDSLDPTEWVKILREQAGVLAPSFGAKLFKPVTNPMPWVPILKVLAPELIKVGAHSMAYACLFAAAPPNRKLSNFDRQSRGVNGKQSIISTVATVRP